MSLPALAVAAFPTSRQATLTGIVTNITGNQIMFKTNSAATYRAETSGATLVRKNGAVMQLGEILVGDKIQVKGKVWTDNSVNATYVRNMTLYVHNSTFAGKIISIDPPTSSFVMESRSNGKQTIRTDSYTTFKKNTATAMFSDLQLGFSVTVKGMWDRKPDILLAKTVTANVRLVNISITGQVVSISPTGLTVLAHNVVYGVDTSQTAFTAKNGTKTTQNSILLGDTVRVQGKHINESVQISGLSVKNMTR